MLTVTKTAGGGSYAPVIVGKPGGMTHVKLDVSTLTTAEVGSDGYLKPGVPLKSDGTLVSGTGQVLYGVTTEATKIRADNSGLSSDTSDPVIAVCTIGLINRDIAEDNLGRAYSANELAAFAAAGCHLQLTTT